MGLFESLDRWATFAAGPAPVQPLRPLVAAGQRVNLRAPGPIHTRRTAWQTDAWSYRDTVPELRFVDDFIASTLGEIKVFPAENKPRGHEPQALVLPGAENAGTVTKTPEITDETRQACAAAVARINLDQFGSTMLARLGQNLEWAGEAYLLGESGADNSEQWTIRSVTEVTVTAGGATLTEPGGGSAHPRHLRDDQCELLRLWNPHPQYYDWPDAGVASMLEHLEAMVLLSRRGRAHDRSRISSGKVLYVPWEFSLSRPGSAPVRADSDGTAEDGDPFQTQLTDFMSIPIADESDPSAVVPLLLRGPARIDDVAAADLVKLIDIHGEDPKDLDSRRDNIVEIIARGINLPREILTGEGDVNHWSAAQIDANLVKRHVKPRATRMCDALTVAYLRPALRAMGIPAEQRNRVCLWFDASNLIQDPDRTQTTKDALGLGLISEATARRELRFSEDDAPTPQERLTRSLAEGRAYEASIPWLIALSGMDFTDPSVLRAIGEVARITTQIGISRAGGPGQPRTINAPTAPAAPGRLPAATPAAPSTSTAGPSQKPVAAAAAKRKGPKDDPDGPGVAGVALIDPLTSRVLMLQRGLDEPDDPAAGTWEFPGGHIEPGDETSLHGGMREWAEEVGRPFPDGGSVLHTWTSPNGVYQGHVVVLPGAEDLVDLDGPRTVRNADDDYSEQSAWWDLDMARRMGPALRTEVRTGTPWAALKRAARDVKSPPVRAAAATDDEEPHPGWRRVDPALSRRLVAIDRDLVTRLHAHAEAAVGRAVEKVANRVRSDATALGRDREPKNPTLAAAFPKGTDPRVVLAAGNLDVATITDRSVIDGLIEGALDDLEPRFRREAAHAAHAVQAVIGHMVTGRAVTAAGVDWSDVARRILDNLDKAWGWLRTRLRDLAHNIIDGRVDGDSAPTALINAAAALLGGLPPGDAGGIDGEPNLDAPGTGPGTGEVALDTLRLAGGLIRGFEWDYHPGIARESFPAHAKLHEQTFEGWDDPALSVASGDEWIGDHYHPQDHGGCRCGAAPVAIFPMTEDPGEPPSLAALTAAYNPLQPRDWHGRWGRGGGVARRRPDVPRGDRHERQSRRHRAGGGGGRRDEARHTELLEEARRQYERDGFKPTSDYDAGRYLFEKAPNLNRGQRAAVWDYTGAASAPMNRTLQAGRQGDDRMQKMVSALDSAMSELPDSLRLTRVTDLASLGVTAEELMERAGRPDGVLVRRAFMSTSLGSPLGVAPVTLHLIAPKDSRGLLAAPYARDPEEREVVLPRGTRWAVTKVTQTGRSSYEVEGVVLGVDEAGGITASAGEVDESGAELGPASRYEDETPMPRPEMPEGATWEGGRGGARARQFEPGDAWAE